MVFIEFIMKFLKEIFEDPVPENRNKSSKDEETIQKATATISSLRVEVQELQMKLANSENRNKTILQSIQNCSTFQNMQLIDELKFEIREKEKEIQFYKENFGEKAKSNNDSKSQNKFDFSSFHFKKDPIINFKKDPIVQNQTEHINSSRLSDFKKEYSTETHESSFFIKDEGLVGVKDQQIIELKAIINDLNEIYKDYDKYKKFYQCLSSEKHGVNELMDKKNILDHFKVARENKWPFFEGVLLNSKKQGFCGELNEHGHLFFGAYENGIRKGNGRLETESFVFEGEFEEGEMVREKGTFIYKKVVMLVEYSEGVKYEGDTVRTKPEGRGSLIFTNGFQLCADFVAGKMAENSEITLFLNAKKEVGFKTEVIHIEGVDAVILKLEGNHDRYIWNVKSGEIKQI